MSEETKTAQRYQWIKSEKTGNVVEVERSEGEWTYFQGGSRIHTSLIPEFLLPLEAGALPLQNDLNTINSIPMPETVEAVDVIEQSESSPISILFNKQKKNVKEKLKIELPIEIPKEDIYNIISGSFDKGEVKDELEKFILKQLDQDKITDLIFKAVENLIKDQYKGV